MFNWKLQFWISSIFTILIAITCVIIFWEVIYTLLVDCREQLYSARSASRHRVSNKGGDAQQSRTQHVHEHVDLSYADVAGGRRRRRRHWRPVASANYLRDRRHAAHALCLYGDDELVASVAPLVIFPFAATSFPASVPTHFPLNAPLYLIYFWSNVHCGVCDGRNR